jgi:hypothetical protein
MGVGLVTCVVLAGEGRERNSRADEICVVAWEWNGIYREQNCQIGS